jgi:hypothetical protein
MLEGPSPYLAAFTCVLWLLVELELWISFENPQIIRREKKKIEEKKSKFGNDIEDVMDSLLIVLLH